jgi:DNA-binding LacI/PurR family transcriptional regulator
MGSQACRALMAALDHEKMERGMVEFPMKLIVRQSTGPAPERN